MPVGSMDSSLQPGGERSGNRGRAARTSRGGERLVLPGLPQVAIGLGEILDECDRLHASAATLTAQSVEVPAAIVVGATA